MKETRQIIIEAAILVFNEDFSAPLEKVADKANITRRTLHRYFKDRNELVTLCEADMQRCCNKAMNMALNSSEEPLEQLKNMLFAAIDCGAKYSFFHKVHNRTDHSHSRQNDNCAEYDDLYTRYRNVILRLQDNGEVSRSLTTEWIYTLFAAVVTATVNAESHGAVAKNSLKQFAWFSFSKGIGI
ncbi:TetR/AcrR family transcriptional regulator [Parapedobacter tibetensis]|uniref:TetR/AcrR family transcriptional regulator n=1 Tax=Parapedobacter tibetensis TaxID=2972951 RepID=UPI00214DAB16|nr:TetR family transcriptional regulator [Parapedobacter tibetensis]